jgi:predicted alpha/beta hydrolase
MTEPASPGTAGAGDPAAARVVATAERPTKVHIRAGAFRLALHGHPARGQQRAVVLLGHAMMSHAGALRPIARNLTLLGCSVWRLDFRGHGASEGAARFHDWSFDHLVREDWPAAVAWVRANVPDLPLIAIGHSLGGLVALAAQATARARVDAIGVLASGLWHHRDTGLLYGNLRRIAGQATLPIVRWAHRLPARRLGLGVDESVTFWRQVVGWGRCGTWTALDGYDYLAALRGIDVPVRGWRGARDPFVRMADHQRLLEAAGGTWTLVPGAGHMDLPLAVAPEIGDWVECVLGRVALCR